MPYKVGDRVRRLIENDICRIIATKDVPHKIRVSEDEIIGEYPTLDGFDYVVISEDLLKSENRFSAYFDVKEGELRNID